MEAALASFDGWLASHLDQLRTNPGNNLMSQLIAAREDGVGLNDMELRATAGLVLAAGFETTVDGQFGRGTKRRVRAWESEAGRKVNGKVSRPDAKALRVTVESSSTRQPPAAPTTSWLIRRAVTPEARPRGRRRVVRDRALRRPRDRSRRCDRSAMR